MGRNAKHLPLRRHHDYPCSCPLRIAGGVDSYNNPSNSQGAGRVSPSLVCPNLRSTLNTFRRRKLTPLAKIARGVFASRFRCRKPVMDFTQLLEFVRMAVLTLDKSVIPMV